VELVRGAELVCPESDLKVALRYLLLRDSAWFDFAPKSTQSLKTYYVGSYKSLTGPPSRAGEPIKERCRRMRNCIQEFESTRGVGDA
jgi:hypothetical protein